MTEECPCGFHFPLKTIFVAIHLVVWGLLSLRGTRRAFQLFGEWFSGDLPCHTVIQNWVLRLGLHKLRKGATRRQDWVYILDHTIEFGKKKCLVVLGITLERFRANQCKVSHRDVEVLGIGITERADAASVEAELRRIAAVCGVPVQILSDKGSNIKKGVSDFVGTSAIRHTHDVTHKAALILEQQLKHDESWQRFITCACDAKRGLIHTALAFAAPPKPKDKARWANLDTYVKWADMALAWEKEIHREEEHKLFKIRLSWLHEFEKQLVEWRLMLDILTALKDEVRNHGLSRDTQERFLQKIRTMTIATPRVAQVRDDALAYLAAECAGFADAHPGCSDIIESIFGKYKLFSGKSPMKEIGKAVLSIPVFTGHTTREEVKTAMESVSAKEVNAWLAQNLGSSLFSKRKKAFKLLKTKNQVKKFPKNLKKVASF